MPAVKRTLPEGYKQLAQDTEAIKKAFLGDDYTHEGLIARFSRVEKILDRSRFTLLGLTLFACGGLYEWIKKLLNML